MTSATEPETTTAPNGKLARFEDPSQPATRRFLSKAIPPEQRMVVRRDKTKSSFDLQKIIRAIALAYYEVKHGTTNNPYRDEPLALYGLDDATYTKVTSIAESVEKMLEMHYRDGRHPSIEQIQDAVEYSIAGAGDWDIARAYVVYRANHAARRLTHYADNGLADYIAMAKYARYRPDLGRREIFSEGVDRVRDMHLEKFKNKLSRVAPIEITGEEALLAGENLELLKKTIGGKDLESLIYSAFHQITEKRILPSMRSMQFGGDAVLKNEARLYNCSFSNVDRLEFFREYFFLLLSGAGVGFSVQKHHVARLPALPPRANEDDLPVEHFIVEDTIEGWADALHALIMSFYRGVKVEFSYAKIRPKGAPLKTSGGKAPGHRPLKKGLDRVESILREAAGRALRPIEVYDINMFIAKAVLSGGIRRSATICLFSPDDDEMISAKTGNWFEKNRQRSASNNSAVISRDEANKEAFKKLFAAQKQFGEPGFYFCDNKDAGANPCVEIGLMPVLSDPTEEEVKKLYAYGYQGDLPGTTRLSGFQFCNLTTINGAAATTAEAFYKACIWAAFTGTLQAAYTNIPYLGPITRVINEREALLGVSICGFMDNPEVLFNEKILTAGAHLCRAVNRIVAKSLLDINPAARLTCTKPEGTASLILGAASGIHGHHARRYFRRVQANRQDHVYQFFKQFNPQMTEPSAYGETDDVITFPVEAPTGAILRKDLTATRFLDLVRLVQKFWVLEGVSSDTRFPDINHNVSNTCTVEPNEWEEVEAYIWDNRHSFTGISLLQSAGDKGYVQAPREEVSSESDVAKWNALRVNPVDYTQMREESDNTALKMTAACAGGACETNI